MERDYSLNYVVNAGASVNTLKSVGTAIVGMTADANSGDAAINKLSASIQAIGAKATGSFAEVRKFSNEIGGIAADAQGSNIAVDRLGTAILKAGTNATQGVAAVQIFRTEIAGMRNEAHGAAAAIGDMGSSAGQQVRNIAEINSGLSQATHETRSFTASLGGLMPAWQALEFGIEIIKAIGQEINSARQHMRDMGTDASDMRDKMRELANLKGETGPDDAIVSDAVLMGMEGGMTPEDATRYLEQFEGSSPAGRQKGNITPEVEKELALEGMKFGTRVALQPKTAGDLAGVLSQYGKIGSVEEGAGKLGAIAHGLNEGRGNLEPLTRSLLKTAGAVVDEAGGPVPSTLR